MSKNILLQKLATKYKGSLDNNLLHISAKSRISKNVFASVGVNIEEVATKGDSAIKVAGIDCVLRIRINAPVLSKSYLERYKRRARNVALDVFGKTHNRFYVVKSSGEVIHPTRNGFYRDAGHILWHLWVAPQQLDTSNWQEVHNNPDAVILGAFERYGRNLEKVSSVFSEDFFDELQDNVGTWLAALSSGVTALTRYQKHKKKINI